ncbi:MAG: flagellar biosynthesis protein FlhF [Pseudomonadota bacterium]
MKVKKYFAESMRSALDQVKQEQGPDVLILSNRQVDGGIELVTADADSVSGEHRAELGRAVDQLESNGRSDPLDSREYLWTDPTTVAHMRDELQSLRKLLEQQLSGLAWSDFGRSNPRRAYILRLLYRLGIAPQLANEIVSQIPEDLDPKAAWHRALALLVVRLETMDDPIAKGGRFAIFGPTGSGKSTLISKLAARFALERGAQKVAVISMDGYRLGAHHQMTALGRLLGITVNVARASHEIPAMLDALSEKRLVLIDTPSFVADDPKFQQLLGELLADPLDIQAYLTIPAAADYMAMLKFISGAGRHAMAGCALTKIDEAGTLGPALSAVIESGLPLAYLSSGQQVPGDLDNARARPLVLKAVAMAGQQPAAEGELAFEASFAKGSNL